MLLLGDQGAVKAHRMKGEGHTVEGGITGGAGAGAGALGGEEVKEVIHLMNGNKGTEIEAMMPISSNQIEYITYINTN